jgi:hypothetical protein
MSEISKYIQAHLVMLSWGNYEGVKEPTVAELGALIALAQMELAQKAAVTAK